MQAPHRHRIAYLGSKVTGNAGIAQCDAGSFGTPFNQSVVRSIAIAKD
ncbi:MAG TPA: hypothetical protein VIF37_17215 [Methylobacter sp.]